MKNLSPLKQLFFLCFFLVFCGVVSAQDQYISNVHLEYSCPCRVTVTYDLAKGGDVALSYSPDTVGVGWLLAKTFTGKTVGTDIVDIWDCEATNAVYGVFYYKLEYIPCVTHDYVMINGVNWATRNVDKPGTFTECPENAGMFYKWDSMIGWSTTNPITSYPNGYTWSNAGSTASAWQSGNNPCPVGFRVPTLAELQSLANTTYVTYVWTTLNGVRGAYLTDTGADGRGNAGNSIFLPAAGSRQTASGNLYGVDMYAYIWSSERNYTYTNNSYILLVGVMPAAISTQATLSALSVRPVVQ